MSHGFLGTAASRETDVTLLIELGMGLALGLGAVLARRGWYRAHGWCQSAAVLLNLAVIIRNMWPPLRRQLASSIPEGFAESYYLLAWAHAVLGICAESLAVYILLVAGTNLLPRQLRFVKYKPWMRAALALWWTALLLGVLTYVRWYVVPLYA